MSYNLNNFVLDPDPGDRNLYFLDKNGKRSYSINPYHITNIQQVNNLLRVNLKTGRFRDFDFANHNIAIEAVTYLQERIDILLGVTPFTIDKEIERYVERELQQVVGGSKPVYQSGNPLTTSGDNQPTGIFLSKTPNDFSRIQILVNGQGLLLGTSNINTECYFSPNGITIRDYDSLEASDQLYFNGSYIGYDLDGNDDITIIYESND